MSRERVSQSLTCVELENNENESPIYRRMVGLRKRSFLFFPSIHEQSLIAQFLLYAPKSLNSFKGFVS